MINKAFIKLRQTKIESLNDKSPRAVAALDVFDYVRDKTMSVYEWGFCTFRIAIEPEKDENGKVLKNFEGYTIFKQPKGFLRKLKANRPDSNIFFEGNGVILAMGDEPLWLRYLGIEEDEKKWPPWYVAVNIDALSIELADYLQCGEENFKRISAMYDKDFADAVHNESYNKPVQKMPQSDFEDAFEFGIG